MALKANRVDYLQGFDDGFDDEVEIAESYLVKVLKNGTTCTTMDKLGDHNYYSKTTREVAIYKPYYKGILCYISS